MRRTQRADAGALRNFRCSSGAWYETEAELLDPDVRTHAVRAVRG
ncbi:MAG TPA: hypothetical protein VGQ42_15145 [Candidatus Dormibacteraeota bacterium]|nr:hypothetical protein [Candidatus Dormibacteraeota bacterium]